MNANYCHFEFLLALYVADVIATIVLFFLLVGDIFSKNHAISEIMFC